MKIGTIDLSNARVGSSLATLYIGQTQVWPVGTDDISINWIESASGQYVDLGVSPYDVWLNNYYSAADRGLGIEVRCSLDVDLKTANIWRTLSGENAPIEQRFENNQIRTKVWNAFQESASTDPIEYNTPVTVKTGIKHISGTANNGEMYVWDSYNNNLVHVAGLSKTSSENLSYDNIKVSHGTKSVKVYEFNIYNGPIINSDGTWKSDYTRLYHYVPVLHYVEGTGYVPCLKGTNWQTADVNYYYPNTGTLIYG